MLRRRFDPIEKVDRCIDHAACTQCYVQNTFLRARELRVYYTGNIQLLTYK
jgi:hypothetical protein